MQNSVLLGILITLLSHDRVSTADLARKFEISRRSVFRYINVLAESEVPIVSHGGKNGGISIVDSYKLPATFFTETEYNRLIPAVKSFDLQDEVTESIVDKLTSISRTVSNSYLLQSDQLQVDTPMTQALQDKFSLITASILSKSLLNMTYHDRRGNHTVRLIEPYCLLLKDGIWYVYSYCRLREDFRFFKISRIVSLVSTYREFSPREFDVNKAKQLQMPATAEDIDFNFTLNTAALADVEEWLGISAVTSLADQQYYAEARLPFDSYLISKLLSFGGNIKVNSPDKLVREMKKALKNTLEIYNQQ